MGRLSLVASNPVKDGLDAYSSLNNSFIAQDAAKIAADKDARDSATAALQQQQLQNSNTAFNNQQTDQRFGAIRMKIGNGIPLTDDEQALVQSQTGQSAQAIPVDQGSPLTMPDDPHDDVVKAAQDKAPSMWAQMAAATQDQEKDGPPDLTKPMVADRAVLLGMFGKMKAAQAQGANYTPSMDEYKILAREVVNNPAFTDSDLSGQQQAVNNVQDAFSQLKGITQPTLITDPGILAAVNKAFPRLGDDSNLDNAQATKLYIQPSPDGDPMKAQITIGVSGTDSDGNVVDGVVTHNRSSDPGDQVFTMTGGQWVNQAQQKQMMLDGLLAAQAEHGNKEVLPIWEQAQQNRATATAMIQQAATMDDGTAKDKLLMEARLLQQGKIPAAQAANIAEKVYHPTEVAEAADAAQSNARELESMRATSAEKIAAGNNAAVIAGHRIAAAASKYAADKHEAADTARLTRTLKHDDSKEVGTLISANTKLLTSLNSKTGSIVTTDPITQQPVVKTYSLDPTQLSQVQAEIAGNNARIDELRGVKRPRQQAIPTPAPAPRPQGKRPPLSSFQH